MNDEVQVDLGKPGYIFNLTADLGNGRNLTVTGNFPVDVTTAQINEELDKFTTAINRKQSQASVPGIEKKVIQLKDILATTEKQLADLGARHQEKFPHGRLPEAEQQNVFNTETEIRAKKDMIRYEEMLLERTRKEAE